MGRNVSGLPRHTACSMLDTLPVDAALHVWEKLREDEGLLRALAVTVVCRALRDVVDGHVSWEAEANTFCQSFPSEFVRDLSWKQRVVARLRLQRPSTRMGMPPTPHIQTFNKFSSFVRVADSPNEAARGGEADEENSEEEQDSESAEDQHSESAEDQQSETVEEEEESESDEEDSVHFSLYKEPEGCTTVGVVEINRRRDTVPDAPPSFCTVVRSYNQRFWFCPTDYSVLFEQPDNPDRPPLHPRFFLDEREQEWIPRYAVDFVVVGMRGERTTHMHSFSVPLAAYRLDARCRAQMWLSAIYEIQFGPCRVRVTLGLMSQRYRSKDFHNGILCEFRDDHWMLTCMQVQLFDAGGMWLIENGLTALKDTFDDGKLLER